MSGGASDLEAMEVHHRGVVMPWECDDMGHMNIRFHVARYEQALRHAAAGAPVARTGSRRVADRFSFVKEARVGARVACSLRLPPEAAAEDAAPVAGCLWDMGSGEVLARFETLFADPEKDCLAGEILGDMAWRDQPVEREWISAMGAFPSPVADGHDVGSMVTGAVSDANAVAVLDLSRGSGYRAEESRVGFVVAELAVAYAAEWPAGARAFSVRSALLSRSARSLRFRHVVGAAGSGAGVAWVRSACVFFDRAARLAVSVPFCV